MMVSLCKMKVSLYRDEGKHELCVRPAVLGPDPLKCYHFSITWLPQHEDVSRVGNRKKRKIHKIIYALLLNKPQGRLLTTPYRKRNKTVFLKITSTPNLDTHRAEYFNCFLIL